jgi:hypothetical protein
MLIQRMHFDRCACGVRHNANIKTAQDGLFWASKMLSIEIQIFITSKRLKERILLSDADNWSYHKHNRCI